MTEAELRTRKYVPSIFLKAKDNPDPEYDGYIVMKLIDYDLRSVLQDKARQLIPKSVALKAQSAIKEGGEEAALEVAESSGGQAMIRAMVKLLPEVLVEVKITRLEDGFVIDNYEDMRYEGGLHYVLTELAVVMLGKQNLTKPKKVAKASGKPRRSRSGESVEATNTAPTSPSTSSASS